MYAFWVCKPVRCCICLNAFTNQLKQFSCQLVWAHMQQKIAIDLISYTTYYHLLTWPVLSLFEKIHSTENDKHGFIHFWNFIIRDRYIKLDRGDSGREHHRVISEDKVCVCCSSHASWEVVVCLNRSQSDEVNLNQSKCS